jgi:hypothetical protein
MSDVVSCSVVGMLSGGSIVLAQTLPGVPDDLKSWPVTAILGLITLLALIGTFYTIWRMFALQEKQTVALTRSVDAQVVTNNRLEELCDKHGVTNTELTVTSRTFQSLVEEWRRRPCGGGRG